ncbi:hypothetical protein M885DRAFT_295233 [Pelagophyceae sp. CCMP2097]|nr:hypothetical protein M885DRAFT_295233 [Pelagophyceae sp. CCMP2097]
MQQTQTAQPPFAATGCAAAYCGAAASCYRCSWFISRKRRSRLTHMSHASQPPFVIAGGAAVACGAAALWLRRRRRSRLTHPPFSVSIALKQLLFLGRAQLFIGRYGQSLEPVYRVKNELYTLFHFWCFIVLLCAASL